MGELLLLPTREAEFLDTTTTSLDIVAVTTGAINVVSIPVTAHRDLVPKRERVPVSAANHIANQAYDRGVSILPKRNYRREFTFIATMVGVAVSLSAATATALVAVTNMVMGV